VECHTVSGSSKEVKTKSAADLWVRGAGALIETYRLMLLVARRGPLARR
jgi:hypothetical protein